MPSADRFYRKVESLDEAQTAIHELTDHVYELRGQVDGHRETISKMQEAQAKLGQGINSQVNGLNVSGSPTANGQKLVWNAATGQLEWQ